ncbi:MAG: hypothetical protein NVSMB2_07500 [Chloroflexota bacterium]
MLHLPQAVLDTADWNNSRLVKREPADELARLKQEDGKSMFIFGSADLGAGLTEHGLIDEYRLGVNPIVWGKGHALFKPSGHSMPLTLVEARLLKSGCVIMRCQPQHAAQPG